MSTEKTCPCEDCISLAICRHKDYYDLFQQCSILRAIEPCYNRPMNRNRVFTRLLFKTLIPTEWHCKEGSFINHVVSRRGEEIRAQARRGHVYDNKEISM
jgi:hypothetical protein